MSIPFVVAIPSYRRAHVLRDRTLRLLLETNLSMDRVYVFCIQEEEAIYRETLATVMGAAEIHVVPGPVGLHNMRNYIQMYFEKGAAVLHMDDDIKDLFCMVEDVAVEDVRKSGRYKLVPMNRGDVVPWVEACFQTTRDANARLWGIYPVRNGFFMKDLPAVTYDLRFCVGTVWGIWNNDPSMEPLHLEEKEDFERTLKAYELDGCVVRFNRVCAATNYYSTPGGMQARGSDRTAQGRESCEYLLQRWPMYCRLYKGKKNGMWEVRLKGC